MASKYPGLSPYNYVLNNPIRLVDLKGNNPFDIFASIMKIVNKYADDANKFFRELTNNEGQKSEEEQNEDTKHQVIVNHGLTNKQIAKVQLHTVNTASGIAMNAELTDAAIDLSAASMGTTLYGSTLLLGAASLLPTYISDKLNGEMTGNYNYTATVIGLVLTGVPMVHGIKNLPFISQMAGFGNIAA